MRAVTSLSERGARRRRHFSGQIVLAVAAVIVIALGLAVLGIYLSTRQSDEVSVERQVRMTQQAIHVGVDELALQQETVAIWDLMAEELTRERPDPVVLHDSVGLWLHNIFGQDEVFILDASDRPVQSAIEGRVVPNSRFDRLRPDLMPFVDRLRGRVREPPGRHDRYPGAKLPADSGVRTTARATHESHLALVGGRPAAASAMFFQPSTPGLVDAKIPPVLISVRYLDGDFLAELGRTNLIESPRFSRRDDRRPGETALLLESESGAGLGYVIWRPELPGSRILGTLAPLNAVGIGALCIVMILLARRLRKTIGVLSAVEAQATHRALHDSLTGLPNRVLLSSRLDEAIEAARDGRGFALLLIDLDQFKQVNDTLGHLAGDELIREFGARLGVLVRPDDTVARLGGDEFAIVLADGWSDEEARRLCAAILDIFARPFILAGTTVFGSASIGAAFSGDPIPEGMEMMRRADVALYRAKADGRHCARFFEPGMDVQTRERAQLETELRAAIDRDEFEIWYQAQVDREGRTIGFEALLRWNHPTEGLVQPDRIVPVAEETGLIGAIGDWVLREAAAVAAARPDLFVAVNLSPVQFRGEDFADRLVAIVREAGADPRHIELEVTERLLLDDHREVRETLAELRRAGFRIALDDFGTGYSSLGYLQEFRVDKIKIDRSFVSQIDRSAESRAIVSAIVTLGHALGLTVMAEGVETEAQAEILRASGCDGLQGYYFARPRPQVTLDESPEARAAAG